MAMPQGGNIPTPRSLVGRGRLVYVNDDFFITHSSPFCGIIYRMKLDPVKMKDWQIAEAAEESLRKASDLAAELGLEQDEWTPYGDVLAKVDVTKVLKRVGAGRRGKYIDVTAITPTALGEGKTTTTLGLVEGLGKLGKGEIVGGGAHTEYLPCEIHGICAV